MIPFTVISASYGNPEQTLVVVKTEERGTLLLTQSGMPEEWAHLQTLDVALDDYEEPALSLAPLTARQLRLGLVIHGFALDRVEAAIAAIPDPQQQAVAKIEWEYAAQFERNHPLIASVGAALGLTEGAVDGMWVEAAIL